MRNVRTSRPLRPTGRLRFPMRDGLHPARQLRLHAHHPTPISHRGRTGVHHKKKHKTEKNEFIIYEAVNAAWKKILQHLVPPKCYESLGSRVTGFKRVSFLTIFSHILTEYGELEDHEIQAIDMKLKADMSGETIFEDLVDQIEDNVEGGPSKPAPLRLNSVHRLYDRRP